MYSLTSAFDRNQRPKSFLSVITAGVKKHSYTPTKLNRVPCGPQNQSGHFGEEIHLVPAGN
jgi:hypothetical protein